MASMFDTIAEMLRGSAPDDLAHALGTDRTQTRRAMEIGLPALITGLRDKTLEPGGATNLSSMLDEAGSQVPDDVGAYLSAGDPSQGAALLDVAFGDRGEPALTALSDASGLSTRLLAQVMSVLAPLATGTIADEAERTPDGMRSYLSGAVADLQEKGFGRVVDLVSPGIGDGTAAVVPVADAPAPVEAVAEIDSVVNDAPSGTLVEGAFPDELEPEVRIDGPEKMVTVPGAMPPPVEAGSVAVLPDAEIDNQTEIYGTVEAEDRPGLSAMGWLWWVLGAILALLLLLFALSQCGGDDDTDPVESTDVTADTTPIVVTPTPNPEQIQRQVALDAVLQPYAPDVRGEVQGPPGNFVAVLTGQVPDQRTKAIIDQEVRTIAGLGVRNDLQVLEVEPAGYSLQDIIAAQPELSTLNSLLGQAGISEALEGNGPFTLFAPTNAAFAAATERLGPMQDDRAALQALLSYHVVNSTVTAADVAALPALTTLQTEVISVSVAESGAVRLNDQGGVLLPDLQARNGVVHIIDGVLFPPSMAPAPPAELGEALGLAPITFALGSSDLTTEGQAELNRVAEYLLATPVNVEIGGHTDNDGPEDLNQQLSEERAEAVRSYLVSQGVPADSLTAIGFGESTPIVANDTDENKARNRRIEFKTR